MTEPIKLYPNNEGYDTVYSFWIRNDKPTYCYMGDKTYMKLSTDGQIVFILVNASDENNYNTVSVGRMV